MFDPKAKPSFIWDRRLKAYYVQQGDSSEFPSYLMDEDTWTMNWKFRRLYKTLKEAVQMYKKWKENQKSATKES